MLTNLLLLLLHYNSQAMHLLNDRSGPVKAGALTATDAASLPTEALVTQCVEG